MYQVLNVILAHCKSIVVCRLLYLPSGSHRKGFLADRRLPVKPLGARRDPPPSGWRAAAPPQADAIGTMRQCNQFHALKVS
ncbi:hypothetical protein LGR54_24260 [Ancylobacter sp. Lp-2]|uniref:hypothetical protein n=1 Tax=Ancylobacter sp. Lp-2 TaxID=2881339 RepID=UPI001E58FAA5|nr:hypothetical protein [Ancylobacter sp. Lp-2]MCB4771730.1 hypothetical protein [Ancylobacter sp. Lp-2]